LDDVIGRVSGLGGDPGSVAGDPNGGVTPKPVGNGGKRVCGMVCEVVYGSCGEFKGFKLETDEGEKRFECMEEGIGNLVERLCESGRRICVCYKGCEVLEIAVEKSVRHREDCGCEKKHTHQHCHGGFEESHEPKQEGCAHEQRYEKHEEDK
jgi:hypothetical protein